VEVAVAQGVVCQGKQRNPSTGIAHVHSLFGLPT
jgi:hypothetical protein